MNRHNLLIIGIALMAVCLAGCEELHPLESIHYKTPVTKVFTNPEGAKIQVDGVDRGKAPVTIIWDIEDKGLHTIRAIPIHAGQCVQRAYVKGEGAYRPSAKSEYPGEIHFDMNDCSKKILLPEGDVTTAGAGMPAAEAE